MLFLGTMRHRDWARPPVFYGVNWDSWQAQDLEYWWPLYGKGDYISPIRMDPLVDANGGSRTTEDTEYGMSAGFDNVGNLRCSATTPRVTAAPITFSAWARPVDSSFSDGSLVSIVDGGSNSTYFNMDYGSGNVRVVARAGSYFEATKSGVVQARWGLFGATFRSSTHRRAWYNGIPGTAITDSVTPSGLTRISIGGLDRNSPAGFHNGGLMDARIYKRELSDYEMFMLYDEPTRWDLYWVPDTRVYVFLGALGGQAGSMPPMRAARSAAMQRIYTR